MSLEKEITLIAKVFGMSQKQTIKCVEQIVESSLLDQTKVVDILYSHFSFDLLMDLPIEIRLMIIEGLSVKEILAVCSSSKSYAEICNDDNFWKIIYVRDFGSKVPLKISPLIKLATGEVSENKIYMKAYKGEIFHKTLENFINLAVLKLPTQTPNEMLLKYPHYKIPTISELTDFSNQVLKWTGITNPTAVLTIATNYAKENLDYPQFKKEIIRGNFIKFYTNYITSLLENKKFSELERTNKANISILKELEIPLLKGVDEVYNSVWDLGQIYKTNLSNKKILDNLRKEPKIKTIKWFVNQRNFIQTRYEKGHFYRFLVPFLKTINNKHSNENIEKLLKTVEQEYFEMEKKVVNKVVVTKS